MVITGEDLYFFVWILQRIADGGSSQAIISLRSAFYVSGKIKDRAGVDLKAVDDLTGILQKAVKVNQGLRGFVRVDLFFLDIFPGFFY